MSAKTFAWNDGSGDMFTLSPYSGEDDGTVAVSSVVNENIDRQRSIEVSSSDITITLTVKQSGAREVFVADDGDFVTADGDFMGVLKQ